MRILLINQYAGSPSLGMEYRPHWMALEWQRQGHEVLVVTADRSHVRTRQPASLGLSGIEGVPYLVVRTTPYAENGPKRFANILSFRAQLSWLASPLAGWHPDVVIASSTHPMDVRPAVRIAGKAKAAFVYEVHDLWPLTPRLLGGMSEKHPMIAWMQREEDFGYANADLAVSLLPNTEPYMREHGLREGRWRWVPNGVTSPEAEVSLSDAAETAIRVLDGLHSTYSKVLIYAGTIGVANALDVLIGQAGRAAELGIAIAIMGDGPERVKLRDECPAPNVSWIDPVPRADVAAVLDHADCAYVGLVPSSLFDHGISPNKVYDYMSAGLPIIENIGAANSPTREQQSGWALDPGDPAGLATALVALSKADSEELGLMGARGRRYVEQELQQERLAMSMLDAMTAAASGGSS